jgi:hypothetical protein
MRALFKGFLALVLAAGTLSVGGCATTQPVAANPRARDDAEQEAKDLITAGAKDAVIVVVLPDGKIFPKTVVVQADVHSIVWWSADGSDLNLVSKDPGYTIKCKVKKGVCSIKQFSWPAWHIDYDGTVGSPGVAVDPRIEIVY